MINDEQIQAPKPVGKFMLVMRRWHHIWHGEAQHTEPRMPMVKLYSEETILSLLAGREADKALIAELKEALEKSQEQSSKWLEAYHKAVSIGARYEERIAELEARTLTAAATDVLAERQRQVTAEGWTPAHDDEHVEGQLSDAAACYALFATDQSRPVPDYWPWPDNWWKQHGERRDLVRAGALIIAEIERLDRAAGITLVVGGEDAQG